MKKEKGTLSIEPSSLIKIAVNDVIVNNAGFITSIKRQAADCDDIKVDKIGNYLFEDGILTLNKEDDNVHGFGIMMAPTSASQTHPTNTLIKYGSNEFFGKIISLSKLRKL